MVLGGPPGHQPRLASSRRSTAGAGLAGPDGPQQFHLDVTVDDIEQPRRRRSRSAPAGWGEGGASVSTPTVGQPFCLCWDCRPAWGCGARASLSAVDPCLRRCAPPVPLRPRLREARQTTEFLTVPRSRSRFGAGRPPALTGDPALVTDDKQMALAVGWALPTRRRTSRRRWSRCCGRVSWPGRSAPTTTVPGETCLRACAELSRGLRWQEATVVGSKGCGAQHAGHPVGVPTWTGNARRGPSCRTVDPRPPDRAVGSELTASPVFALRSRRRWRASRAAHRAGAVAAPGLSGAVAGRPLAARGGRHAAGVHRPGLGRVPGSSGPAHDCPGRARRRR